MKQIFFPIILLLFCVSLIAQKQDPFKSRIDEIRKWYTEVQSLGMKNCQTKRKTEYDRLSLESEKIPFEQVVKTCRLSAEYELTKGDFQGHEWAYEVNIYRKNGKVFFVFVKGGAEGYSYERRYYCDLNENLIKQLEKEADGGAELTGPNKEIKLSTYTKKIHASIPDEFRAVESVWGK